MTEAAMALQRRILTQAGVAEPEPPPPIDARAKVRDMLIRLDMEVPQHLKSDDE